MKYKKNHTWTTNLTLLLTAVIMISTTGCKPDRQTVPHSRFHLLDGSVLSTDKLKGKVWLLQFWATNCASCVKEMPQLKKIHQEYQHRGFEVISMAMSYDTPAYVIRFQQREKLLFKVGFDKNGQNAAHWGNINITPTSFLVDTSGKIIQKTVGIPDFEAMRKTLNRILPPEHQPPPPQQKTSSSNPPEYIQPPE